MRAQQPYARAYTTRLANRQERGRTFGVQALADGGREQNHHLIGQAGGTAVALAVLLHGLYQSALCLRGLNALYTPFAAMRWPPRFLLADCMAHALRTPGTSASLSHGCKFVAYKLVLAPRRPVAGWLTTVSAIKKRSFRIAFHRTACLITTAAVTLKQTVLPAGDPARLH